MILTSEFTLYNWNPVQAQWDKKETANDWSENECIINFSFMPQMSIIENALHIYESFHFVWVCSPSLHFTLQSFKIPH